MQNVQDLQLHVLAVHKITLQIPKIHKLYVIQLVLMVLLEIHNHGIVNHVIPHVIHVVMEPQLDVSDAL